MTSTRTPGNAARIERSSGRSSERARTSSDEVGSSSSSSPGSSISARASATRCASPPESSAGRASRARRREPEPVEQRARAIAAAGFAMPRARSGNATFSIADRCGKSRQVLEHDADRPRPRAGRDAGRASIQRHVVERDPPVVGVEQARPGTPTTVDLPDSVRAEERHGLAPAGLERGVDRRSPRAEPDLGVQAHRANIRSRIATSTTSESTTSSSESRTAAPGSVCRAW